MDIIFNCPHCDQELAVDSEGAGSKIDCPSCHETITIPEKPTASTPALPPAPLPGSSRINPINASAAAKIEMRLKVPLHNEPSASLIQKPNTPLDAVAKGHDKQIRVHTLRHSTCIESGHDKFDEKLTAFLSETGEINLIGVHPINYTYFDVGTQKILTDFGVIVVYRG